jgi:diguanylate cyclase (GGDEF)-like protein
MKLRFTIAGRINLFLILLTIITSLGVSGYLLARESQFQQETVIEAARALAKQGVRQQMSVYYTDRKVIGESLEKFLELPGVRYAALFNLEGGKVLDRYGDGLLSYPVGDFSYLRRGANVLEESLVEHSGVFGSEQFLDLTLPVFSQVNPTGRTIDRNSYGKLITSPRNPGSQYVVGYYHFGISKTWIRETLIPYAQQLAIACLCFILLVAVLTMAITSRITAPLASLAQMADDISAGKLNRKFRSKGAGEIRQIASMLNIVMAELNKYRSKMDTDRHLLSMKVDERTAQLSKRNKELFQAVKQVTQTKNRLRQLAYYDSLTALPNRQLFIEQTEFLLRVAAREKRTVALLFIDLDNFKRINDSLGHSAGDKLLKEVAARLSRCVRDSDLLAKYAGAEGKIGVSRLGGDEFTIVLNSIDSPDAAGTIANRVLESLQAPMLVSGHEVVVTPSIGIAIAPRDAETVEDLLKLADTAMYHAKSSGRNSYRYYTSAMKSSGVGRLRLESELRRAVEKGELELHYQPQVQTRSGKIVGAEALVRWNHPQHGLVPPASFIPLAEEMGLIIELGAWTLLEATRQIKAFEKEGLILPKVAVNVSSLQFNANFTDLVANVLADSELEPKMLELELTERIIMSNARASTNALLELKKLGVSLSVDDFGTGYSSLSYLSKFPLDELKIDRSFVTGFNRSVRSASLVSAIIAMGKSLKLNLVAEGVDQIGQYKFLREHNVDVIQGFLFSKAVPADEFATLLRDNHFPDQISKMIGTHKTGKV